MKRYLMRKIFMFLCCVAFVAFVLQSNDVCARSDAQDAALEQACAKLENWYGKSERDVVKAFGKPDEKQVIDEARDKRALQYRSSPGRTMDLLIDDGKVVDINYGAAVSRLVGGGGRKIKEEQERQRVRQEKLDNAATVVRSFYEANGVMVSRQLIADALVVNQLFASHEEALPFIENEIAALDAADRKAAREQKQQARLEAWRAFDQERRDAEERAAQDALDDAVLPMSEQDV